MAAGQGAKGPAMLPSEVRRAVSAAESIVSELGLAVDDAVLVSNSNKLTLRLLPCDVLARVAPKTHQDALFEIDLARRLAAWGSPVAHLDPRVGPLVYEQDDFAITLWTYYQVSDRKIQPADYANALGQLHAGMRHIDVVVPSFMDRVDQAQQLVASADHTPALIDADRETLSLALHNLKQVTSKRGRTEQLVHGEPHP